MKRRARVVRVFPNRGACLRLVRAFAVEQSDQGVSARRYLNMEGLKEQRSEEHEEEGWRP